MGDGGDGPFTQKQSKNIQDLLEAPHDQGTSSCMEIASENAPGTNCAAALLPHGYTIVGPVVGHIGQKGRMHNAVN